MPHNESIDLIGRCPICRLELVDFGKVISCTSGHYKANFDAWNFAWNRFDANIDDAGEFRKQLLELNLESITQAEIEKIQAEWI